MSKTFAALKKAERDTRRVQRLDDPIIEPKIVPSDDRPASPVPSRLEYEKIRVWLTNPSQGKRLQTVMVVSPHSGTGSTTTAALLASTLAEGKNTRVLIVDSNLRTPGLNLIFETRSSNGIGAAIAEELGIDAEIHATDRKNLFVLTTTESAAHPLDAFDGEALDDMLDALKKRFEFIVFDAAPALDFPDAYAVAAKVDGIILVTEAEKTLIDDAQRAKRDLERAGGRLLGVVLNRHTDYMPSFLQRFFGSS